MTFTSEMKQTKAINLEAVEKTKVKRRRPQKARKAEKSPKQLKQQEQKGEWRICAELTAKEAGRKKAEVINTTTTITRVTTSTFEKTSQTTSDKLKNKKVPNIVRMKKEHDHDFVAEFARDIGVITSWLQLMIDHQIKERLTEMDDTAYYNSPQVREYIATYLLFSEQKGEYICSQTCKNLVRDEIFNAIFTAKGVNFYTN